MEPVRVPYEIQGRVGPMYGLFIFTRRHYSANIQSIAALALFARFFRVVFISGSSHKELLWTYFTAEGILVCLASKFRGSSFLGNNLFDRSHRQIDKRPSGANGGIGSCKPSRGAVIFGR